MQREIIFRGKRIDNGEWAYGGYCYGNNRHYISEDIFLMEREISNEYEVENEGEEPIFEDGLKLGMFHLVIPETVSQFTGLTDKNGVKIFEGDRLRDDWSDDEIIIEDYVTVVWDLENGQWAVDNSFKKDGSSYTNLVEYVGKSNLEIIRNIHDHAKL